MLFPEQEPFMKDRVMIRWPNYIYNHNCCRWVELIDKLMLKELPTCLVKEGFLSSLVSFPDPERAPAEKGSGDITTFCSALLC